MMISFAAPGRRAGIDIGASRGRHGRSQVILALTGQLLAEVYHGEQLLRYAAGLVRSSDLMTSVA
jgi:hypothetical protein